MSQEKLTVLPEHPRDFASCFKEADKRFRPAAAMWTMDRLPALLLDKDTDVMADTITEMEKASLNFGTDILSDHFPLLAEHYPRAAMVVVWSSGVREEQEHKAAVVTAELEKFGLDQDKLCILIDEDKLNLADRIYSMKARLSRTVPKAAVLAANYPDLQAIYDVPILVIEDKITNMMRLMEHHTRIPLDDVFPTDQEGKIKEETLDTMSDAQWQQVLDGWQKYVKTHSLFFRPYSFIYVPPDQSVNGNGEGILLEIRRRRVAEWLEASNEALNTTPTSPGTERQQFYHIAEKPDLNQLISENTLILSDMDGPLTSQRKVIETRDTNLQQALAATLEIEYRKIFQTGVKEVLDYICNEDNTPIIIGKQDQPDIILSKTKVYKGIRLRVNRLAKQGANGLLEFEFNPDNYKRALQSIGISCGKG